MSLDRDDRENADRRAPAAPDRRAVLVLAGQVRWVGDLERSRLGRVPEAR